LGGAHLTEELEQNLAHFLAGEQSAQQNCTQGVRKLHFVSGVLQNWKITMLKFTAQLTLKAIVNDFLIEEYLLFI